MMNKTMKHLRWNNVISAMLAISMAGSLRAAESLVALSGHVPHQIQNATMLQRAPADEIVSLSLVTRLDQNLLDQTLEQLYGRGAPAQKHYLSSAEFAQKFGIAD